jgi:hypothetical protein
MSDLDYKPNSHKSKEESSESKKLEKIVSGPVKTKKNELRKLSEIFISEDAANVKSYIFMDVLVPAIKKAISDIFHNGIDIILFGEAGKSKSSSAASRVSYRDYYDRKDDHPSVNRTRSGYSYEDVVVETRGEAEAVRTRLEEIVDEYGMVSVADLYDLVGITGNYTDNNYGWTNVHNVEIIRVYGGGYMLKMPRAIPIK